MPHSSKHQITVRLDQKDVLEGVRNTNPTYGIRIALAASRCTEFEPDTFFPPGLKDLSVSTDSVAHSRFDRGARVGWNSHR